VRGGGFELSSSRELGWSPPAGASLGIARKNVALAASSSSTSSPIALSNVLPAM
jgi:hypothetical protein